QSELWTALLLFVAVQLYLRGRERDMLSRGRIAALAVIYLGACLFKEHGVVLPALFVAGEATVVADARPLPDRLRSLAPAYVAWFGVAAFYLGWRWVVIGH